jgi:hypothetical protein
MDSVLKALMTHPSTNAIDPTMRPFLSPQVERLASLARVVYEMEAGAGRPWPGGAAACSSFTCSFQVRGADFSGDTPDTRIRGGPGPPPLCSLV